MGSHVSGLAWKAASDYAAAAAPTDWTIVGTARRGTLPWRNSAHDVGHGTPAPSTTFSVSKIGNVGSSAWQSIAPSWARGRGPHSR